MKYNSICVHGNNEIVVRERQKKVKDGTDDGIRQRLTSPPIGKSFKNGYNASPLSSPAFYMKYDSICVHGNNEIVVRERRKNVKDGTDDGIRQRLTSPPIGNSFKMDIMRMSFLPHLSISNTNRSVCMVTMKSVLESVNRGMSKMVPDDGIRRNLPHPPWGSLSKIAKDQIAFFLIILYRILFDLCAW